MKIASLIRASQTHASISRGHGVLAQRTDEVANGYNIRGHIHAKCTACFSHAFSACFEEFPYILVHFYVDLVPTKEACRKKFIVYLIVESDDGAFILLQIPETFDDIFQEQAARAVEQVPSSSSLSRESAV